MKQIFTLFSFLFCLGALIAQDPSFKGAGTAESPYLIENLADMKMVADSVYSRNAEYGNKHYQLTNHITDAVTTVIGNPNAPFSGFFHGSGYTILLNINGNGQSEKGLFGYTRGATIDSVAVTGSILDCGHHTAGIVGRATASTTILHCANLAVIQTNRNSNSLGGIVGRNDDSAIKYCVNYGSITTNGLDTGGICGYLTNDSEVSYCLNFADISSKDDFAAIIGDNNNKWNIHNNYYDKQFTLLKGIRSKDRENAAEGFLTSELSGNSLQELLGTNHYVYTDGIYPRLGAFADNNAILAHSIALTFFSDGTLFDRQTKIAHNFTVTTSVNGQPVTWQSLQNKVTFTDTNAEITASQYDTLVMLINGYERKIPVYIGYDVTVNIRGNGIVDKTGEFMAGSMVILTAVPDNGNFFPRWLDGNTENPRTIELISDTTLTACFLPYVFTGEGSAESPYIITDKNDLMTLAGLVISDNEWYGNKHYKLVADIDEEITSAIGTKARPFSGHFNGGMHTINLNINAGNNDDQGLFGYTNNAVIDSVTVKGTVIGKNHVGGVTGCSYNTSVNACQNFASVTGTNYYVGGVTGFLYENSSLTTCQNFGTIKGNSHVGGLVGEISGSSISQTVNYGNVIANDEVGGILGKIWNSGSVSKSLNVGKVTGTSLVGNIVGFSNGNGTRIIENNYYDRQWTTNGLQGVNYRDQPDGAEGKLTKELTGAMLQNVLETGFSYEENMYPRLTAFALQDSTYIYSVNPLLNHADNCNSILHSFTMPLNVAGETAAWASRHGMININNENATIVKSGTDTLTLTVAGITRIIPVEISKFKLHLKVAGNGSIAILEMRENAQNDTIINVEHHSTLTLIALPDEGYKLMKWSNGSSNNNFNISSLAKDTVISALFTDVDYVMPFEGQGTAENPYLINNRNDMQVLSESVEKYNSWYADKHYKLTSDVDMTGITETIPDENLPDSLVVIFTLFDKYNDSWDNNGYLIVSYSDNTPNDTFTCPRGENAIQYKRKIKKGIQVSVSYQPGIFNGENSFTISYDNGAMINGFPYGSLTDTSSELTTFTCGDKYDNIIFSPVGYNNPFKGHFNGNGHAVTIQMNNLIFAAQGLFGKTEGATIEDLMVRGSISNDYELRYAGGIIGDAVNTTINRCVNLVSMNANYYYSGGIVGTIKNGTIHSCVNYGFSNGGMYGYYYGDNNITCNLQLSAIYESSKNINYLASDTENSNYYDKQLIPDYYSSRMTEKLTKEMVGDELKQTLGNDFIYSEGMYPRLSAFADRDEVLAHSMALMLYAEETEEEQFFDRIDKITHDFTVATTAAGHPVTWQSKKNRVSFNATAVSAINNGHDTLNITVGNFTRKLPIYVGYDVEIYIVGNGVVHREGGVTHGSTVTLKAQPDSLHQFAGWYDGVMDNPRNETLTDNGYYIAIFTKHAIDTKKTIVYGDTLVLKANTDANRVEWYDVDEKYLSNDSDLQFPIPDAGEYTYYLKGEKSFSFSGTLNIQPGDIVTKDSLYVKPQDWDIAQYQDNKESVGIVASNVNGKYLVLSFDYKNDKWSEEKIAINTSSATDGRVNMATIKNIENWETNYPAFKWCDDLGEGWYLPAIDELQSIAPNIMDLKEELPWALTNYPLWSSTEINPEKVYTLKISNDGTSDIKEHEKNSGEPRIWAMKQFDESDLSLYSIYSAAVTDTVTITVQPRELVITADDKTKYEGEDDPELTWTMTSGSLVANDAISGTLTYSGVAAGNYDIVEDIPFSAGNNYNIVFVNGTMTILNPAGLSGNFANDVNMKVYPNPVKANDWVYINIPLDENLLTEAVIDVYSMDGLLLQQINVNGNLVQTQLSLPQGLYIFTLKNNNTYIGNVKVVVK